MNWSKFYLLFWHNSLMVEVIFYAQNNARKINVEESNLNEKFSILLHVYHLKWLLGVHICSVCLVCTSQQPFSRRGTYY